MMCKGYKRSNLNKINVIRPMICKGYERSTNFNFCSLSLIVLFLVHLLMNFQCVEVLGKIEELELKVVFCV